MAKRIINMYEYRHIIYYLRQGQSIRSIAKAGLAGRTKVNEVRTIASQKGWLSPEAELPDDKQLAEVFAQSTNGSSQSSKAHAFANEIEKWVDNGIQASTIHQHLVNHYQFTGSYNSIQRYVQKLKAQRQSPNLTVPLTFEPGEAAQVDFGQGPVLYDERVQKEVKTWFFVMTLCWSRHQYAELVTHQDIETWLNCHQNAFEWFGGVPGKIIIDNPKCAITKACYQDPEVQRSYGVLAQDYYFIIDACPPRDPAKKGRVESGIKYVKNNFTPLRTFQSLQDANRQLKTWVTDTAGQRQHGSTFKQPLSQFNEVEQHQLKALPATPPKVAVWKQVSLYRDCHIRYQRCQYSAPHHLQGETLWAQITANTVTIYHDHRVVAEHARQFIPGEFSTRIAHMPPKARYYFKQDQAWCLKQSQAIGPHCRHVIEDLLTDPERELLRQAQRIIQLQKRYSPERIDKACQRAIQFDSVKYTIIKTILDKEIDHETIDPHQDSATSNPVYQGQGLYQRDIQDIVHSSL